MSSTLPQLSTPDDAPERARVVLREIATLRERQEWKPAEILVQSAIAEFGELDELLVAAAGIAQRSGAHTEAAERWARVRERMPQREDGYIEAAKSLREDRQFDEADRILQLACERLPQSDTAFIERAWLAQISRDWPRAVARWEGVRTRTPHHVVGYTMGSVAMRESGELTAAEALLQFAAERFPDHAEVLTERAILAQASRDWSLAAERWQALRLACPDRLLGYTAGATALREMGDPGAADALLSQAAAAFPAEAGLAITKAQSLVRQARWADALHAWSEVQERFPGAMDGYIGCAQVLRHLGKPQDADQMLLAARTRFPDDPTPEFEFAWRAHHSRDWPEALRRWDAVRQRHPDNPAGFIGGAVSRRELRRDVEADDLLQTAMARFPTVAACAIEHAWLRHARRDWQAALPRWVAACESFPDQQDAWLRRAMCEIELWQYDAAELTLREAMARFPDAINFATEYAAIASRQTRWEEASLRYGNLRTRFPDDIASFIGGAAVLKAQFRLDDAERVLDDGIARIPQEPRLRLERALLPIVPLFRADRRYDITLHRLAELRRDFPAFAPGILAAVRLLRELGQFAAAERVAAAATGEPGVELTIEHARIAADRGDHAEACRRFEQVQTRYPDIPVGYLGLVGALSESGRHDEAEAVIAVAAGRFPGDAGTFAAFGQVAARRQDWREALARWTEGQSRFPDDQQFTQRIYEAQTRLSEMEPDPDAQGDAAPPVVDRSGPFKAEIDLSLTADMRQQMRDLAMQFESLGGRDIGCEFGMVQRACGAEPLGLLRWADMPPDALMTALENRFAGVGDKEHTELFLDGLNRPEYCTRDRRGMMYSRAFIYADEIEFDKMYVQSCRRLKFLTRKLIEDLEQGSKIFVYRFSRRDLTDAELARLHQAVRSYGHNTLLYVRYADADHPAGSVTLTAPGLLVGYMEKFKVSRSGTLDAVPPTDAWMAVCRAAYALWSEAQA